jgi:hypothetical protein
VNYLAPLSLAAIVFFSQATQAESPSPFISIMAIPYAGMNADVERETEYRQVPSHETDKFNMTLGQGYGVRLSAWNLYISYTESVTDTDSEIPDARFKTFTAGFIEENVDEEAYPVGLYARWGMGVGQGELRYAHSGQNEDDWLTEVFIEGGLTIMHDVQIGLQTSTKVLFEVGDTRASLVDIALVASMHF